MTVFAVDSRDVEVKHCNWVIGLVRWDAGATSGKRVYFGDTHAHVHVRIAQSHVHGSIPALLQYGNKNCFKLLETMLFSHTSAKWLSIFIAIRNADALRKQNYFGNSLRLCDQQLKRKLLKEPNVPFRQGWTPTVATYIQLNLFCN